MTVTETRSNGLRTLASDAGDGVRIAFTDRHGGVSRAPYDSLNLAARVGDDRAAVQQNRVRVADVAGFDLGALCLARQVHAADAIEARPGDSGVLGAADVVVTSAPGTTIAILTADCAPVVMAGDGRAAIAHAGWRGIVAGAVERAIVEVGEVRRAWIGPSIHSCCYVVGPEVRAEFAARDLPVTGDRVDPARAAETILRRNGVEEVWVSEDCTHCDVRYYSFRRDGVTGRQGGFATLS